MASYSSKAARMARMRSRCKYMRRTTYTAITVESEYKVEAYLTESEGTGYIVAVSRSVAIDHSYTTRTDTLAAANTSAPYAIRPRWHVGTSVYTSYVSS